MFGEGSNGRIDQPEKVAARGVSAYLIVSRELKGKQKEARWPIDVGSKASGYRLLGPAAAAKPRQTLPYPATILDERMHRPMGFIMRMNEPAQKNVWHMEGQVVERVGEEA
jgi:hypothetical protein